MKKILLTIILLFLMIFGEATYIFCTDNSPIGNRSICKSIYKFSSDCIKCHLPPDGDILPPNIKRIGDIVYISISRPDFDDMRNSFLALKKYKIKKIILDLFSYGGSLFDAMGMVALLREQEIEGRIIEIRARGIVASAGLIIMASGTKGHRYINQYALVMFHEFWSMKIFSIETPSDKEEEAKIMRSIQDKVDEYLVSRSKITKEELRSKIRRKEFWMDAEAAIQYGFADHLMGHENK